RNPNRGLGVTPSGASMEQVTNEYLALLAQTGGQHGRRRPKVWITSPTSGAVASGTLPVDANATAGMGVAGVQFKLDGANLGSEDTSSPYAVDFNTTTVVNGNHMLTAVARDISGGTATSTGVTVNVENAAPAPPPPPPPPP